MNIIRIPPTFENASPPGNFYSVDEINFSPTQIPPYSSPSGVSIIQGTLIIQNANYEEKEFGAKNIAFKFVEHFSWNEIEYKLRTPALCTIEAQDNFWIIECSRYEIIAYGENKEEAEKALNEEFIFLCKTLLNEKDENLTRDAIILRDLLKQDII